MVVCTATTLPLHNHHSDDSIQRSLAIKRSRLDALLVEYGTVSAFPSNAGHDRRQRGRDDLPSLPTLYARFGDRAAWLQALHKVETITRAESGQRTSDTIAEADGWKAVSFVIASRYREGVIFRLATCPAVPTRIATDTDMRVEHVSRALRELQEHSLVKLLVPDERWKGWIYGLTDRGTRISTLVEELR